MKELLNQTYGVEIEMHHITREKAATVVCATLASFGVQSTVDHVYGAYDAWNVTETNSRRVWQLMSDSSIVARTARERCELVTPILGWSDMELLQQILRDLRAAGGRSDPAHSCGIHVHVGGDHTAQSLRNLSNIMASHEQLLCGALALDSGRTSQWCRPVDFRFLRELNAKKPGTLAELKNVWYQSQGASYGTDQHYNQSRYHMLNLHSYFTGKGVEFRLFQFDNYDPAAPAGRKGGIHAGQLKAYVQLCLALNYRAMHTRTAKCTPLQSDNPKYTMRCWLLRLGFIGADFETARDILTRRLDGDCSFRHGRPGNAADNTTEEGAA